MTNNSKRKRGRPPSEGETRSAELKLRIKPTVKSWLSDKPGLAASVLEDFVKKQQARS